MAFTTDTISSDGLTLSASEWARRLGLKVQTLYARLNAGRTVEEALTL